MSTTTKKAGEEYFMRRGEECGSGRATGTQLLVVDIVIGETIGFSLMIKLSFKMEKRKR